MTTRRSVAAVATLLALSLTATACAGDSTEPTEPNEPAERINVTFGVQGAPEEVQAWKQVVADHDESSTKLETTMVEWADRDEARRAIVEGDLPDVFLATRSDLGLLLDERRIQPVSELLDERGVDFGDRFSRDAVEAFGMHGELQCMAYSISPTVMYLNTDLVDFEAMEAQELDTPNRTDRWNMAEFTAAAEFASRPRRGTVGFHVDPTVAGLAPFVLSGGGQVVDDAREPSTLTFSTDQTREALESSLGVLRNASLTLGEEQLAQRPAVEWFERGKLGMLAGQRDLVPRLRAVEGLNFDVMPMPRVDDAVTAGEVTGLCISRDTRRPAAAADLIAHLVGDEPTTVLARAGATQPANLAVAGSEDFLQPDQQPENSPVFNSVVRRMGVTPLVPSWTELEEAMSPFVTALLREPGDIDLMVLTEELDLASAEFFNPGSTTEGEDGEGGDDQSGEGQEGEGAPDGG